MTDDEAIVLGKLLRSVGRQVTHADLVELAPDLYWFKVKKRFQGREETWWDLVTGWCFYRRGLK